MSKLHNLKIGRNQFDLIKNGSISHIVVCREENIEVGDCVMLQVPQIVDSIIDLDMSEIVYGDVVIEDAASLKVKVVYKDIEGSGIEDGYEILSIRRV